MTRSNFDWSAYSGNLDWLASRTILLTKHGSQAYGTSLPTSDLDVKGVAVPPREYFHGFVQRFEQAESKNPDFVVYDIRKFCNLATDCNPNIIEVLWTDPSDWLQVAQPGLALVEARSLFLSRKAKHTFSGYAAAQLKRIRTHNRWLLHPPAAPPTRSEFGLPEHSVINSDDRAAAFAAMQKQVESWDIDFAPLDKSERIALESKIANALAEMRIGSDEKWDIAGRTLGFSENFIDALARERRYRTAHREWEQYLSWQKTRNAARAELEAKYGYDCYLDDTEFLTDSGWRKYDAVVTDDRLATLNQTTGAIEYQHYTERVSKPYSGKIGLLTPRHSNCAVTLNHRMLVSPAHRNKSNNYSWSYTQESAAWVIRPLHELMSGYRSYYHVRLAGEPRGDTEIKVSDDYLILMGSYVSEGSIGKRLSDGNASVLRISQKKGGFVCKAMDTLMAKMPEVINRYETTHKEESRREPCVEQVWTVAHREWADRLDRECGSHSTNRRLPFWTRELSTAQVKLLLAAMLDGDGTPHGKGWVYYTSSKQLADDVQAMCVSAGIVSTVWGPYPNDENSPMYQVFIGQEHSNVVATSIRESGSQSFEVIEVNDTRVVCFTVPNEILVTRRNGQIAIQGNTKHGMHLVRLMRMCREILETGQVIVRRPDAEELLAIRHGAWPFERLVEWAEREDAALTEVAKTSALPHSPDRKKLDAICARIVESLL